MLTDRDKHFSPLRTNSIPPRFFRDDAMKTTRHPIAAWLPLGSHDRMPIEWVVGNVLPNIIKRFFVTDNVVVVAALPDTVRIRVFTEPFGYTDFETTYNRAN